MKPNELLAAILKASGTKRQDDIPAGFKTSTEWAAEWNRARRTAEEVCAKGVAAGLLKKITLRRLVNLRLRNVNYFAEVKR